jgi:hypothetical protein
MRSDAPCVTVTGTKLSESAKAIQFKVDSVQGEPLDKPVVTWFPFSQTAKIFTKPEVQGEDYLIVSEWLCKQKDLL